MAGIFPLDEELSDIQEGTPVNLTFEFIAGPGDSLVSINITDYQANDGIVVQGANYKGSYQNSFNLGNDALSYRDGDEFKTATKWEDLPPPGGVDLYLWKAPSQLQRTYSYTVTVSYWYQPPAPEPDPENPGGSTEQPPPILSEIKKTYTQLVYGNWSVWANLLRNYVYAGE